MDPELDPDPEMDPELDLDTEPDPDPLVRDTDPGIRNRIRTKMSRIPNTVLLGFVTGSNTRLLKWSDPEQIIPIHS
jgi:hypothetical protein